MALLVLLLGLFLDLDEDRKELLGLLRDRRDPRELVDARERAVRKVGRHEGAEAVEALFTAYALLEQDAVDLERERERASVPTPESRLQLDAVRVIQALLREGLQDRPDAPGRAAVRERVWKDRDLDHSLRMALTRRSGAIPEEEWPHLVRALASRDTSEVLGALGLARGQAGRGAALVAPVAALLDHRDPAVRVEAATTLARLADPGGIEPLIRRLGREEGRLQQEIAAALEVLTGRNLGASPGAWERWWEAEGRDWLAGDPLLGQGTSTVQPTASSGYYFDIPQDGAAILYLVDVSNSMKVRLPADPQYAGEKAKGPRRLDRAKEELKKALAALRPGTRFNVVAFAAEAEAFQKRMVEATPRAVAQAGAWIDALEPQLGTQTYDALEQAFRVAGRGARDRYYESAVDTIFLLSDGRPTVRTTGGGRQFVPDQVARILDEVGRWNVLGRVVVHCIAIGQEERSDFLGRLAAQNGGTCRQVD